MKKIFVNKNDIGIALWKYLLNIFPNKTKSWIKREINKGNIKVNNKKVFDNYLIKLNDEIFIYSKIKNDSKFLKCELNIEIFYEDDNIIIFNKPKGILSQEDKNEKINTLNNFIKKYIFLKEKDQKKADEVGLIHRLDKNTEGLIIGCKNKNVLKIMNSEMNKHNITKKYIAIVHGKPKKRILILKDYIKKDLSINKMIVSKNFIEHSKEITTKIKLIESIKDLSLLEVEIKSGKKHQIRAHLAFHKMPILGDFKYQNKKYISKIVGQALISNEVIFNIENDKMKYLNNMIFRLYDLNKKNEIEKILQKYLIL